MGWRFPKRKPRPDNVMDYRDFQEATQPFVEELGSLDETNFSSSLSSQLTPSNMAVDVHRRYFSTSVSCNDDVRDETDPDYSGSDIQRIQIRDTWVPIRDLVHEFTSRGGTVDVSASLQCWRPDSDTAITYEIKDPDQIPALVVKRPPNGTLPEDVGDPLFDGNENGGGVLPVDPATGVYDDYDFSNTYFLFAVELDGNVIAETVVGDLDISVAGTNMEYGLAGFVFPAHLEATLSVAPGTHRLRIVTRLVDGVARHFYQEGNLDNVQTAELGGFASNYPYGSLYVGSRELVLLEDS